ncbi:MAG: hypothetical protein CUN48_06220 [Candidatus Thermofonsia Clade 3 bacterium]|uniref:Uncharacterized protein n=1 Tax=Candidatus Thermofonsia Clade 3 bacterium TaxID=2364212 RepID=A0A2M8QDP2_9CHLR|nr:MAG: hypothetical protein CUN48_06220 [Candidatus Thermofonsia Clade 3 bacterium]
MFGPICRYESILSLDVSGAVLYVARPSARQPTAVRFGDELAALEAVRESDGGKREMRQDVWPQREIVCRPERRGNHLAICFTLP